MKIAATAYDAPPRSEEWRELRRTGIGGSDAATVLGLNPYKGPLALYYEKRGEIDEPDRESDAMAWGVRLEQVVADHYSGETGLGVVGAGATYRHDAHAFMLANPDRWVLPAGEYAAADPSVSIPSPAAGILEIKTTAAWNASTWDADAADGAVIQWQHYAEVCDVDWGHIAVLIGGQAFRVVEMRRDRELGEMIVAAEAEFWERVTTGDPPPPDGSRSSSDVLAALYDGAGGTVALDDIAQVLDDLRGVRTEIAALDRRKTELENRIKAALGDATDGTVDGSLAVTWRPSTRTRIDTRAVARILPDPPAGAADAYRTTSTTRRFLVKDPTP